MRIRFDNGWASYTLVDPEVVESSIFGICFHPTLYKAERMEEWRTGGLFPLRDAVLIEPVPEQLALAA